jgi:hypothetical protein
MSVPVLNLLILDEGLGCNSSSRKIWMPHIKASIENCDPNTATSEAGGRDLGGL